MADVHGDTETATGSSVKVGVEELEACKRKLAVEAPTDVVQRAWERAYGRVQKQARLPGFRKGHVPRALVKLPIHRRFPLLAIDRIPRFREPPAIILVAASPDELQELAIADRRTIDGKIL